MPPIITRGPASVQPIDAMTTVMQNSIGVKFVVFFVESRRIMSTVKGAWKKSILPALEAVLAELQRESVDEIVFARLNFRSREGL